MIESDTSTVILSHHYEREGVHYTPGDELTLPTADARSLVAAGYAQALLTPMVDNDPDGTTKVRSSVPTRLTTAGGTTYAWAHEGEAIAVRNADLDAVLALPGITLADPVEDTAGSGLGTPVAEGSAISTRPGSETVVRTAPTGTPPPGE